MKKSRFTDSQIIAVLKQAEANAHRAEPPPAPEAPRPAAMWALGVMGDQDANCFRGSEKTHPRIRELLIGGC